MTSNHEWLLASLRDDQQQKQGNTKLTIPSFPEFLASLSEQLLEAAQHTAFPPQNIILDTNYVGHIGGAKVDEKEDAPLLLSCGNNLLAKFKQYYTRITFVDLNILRITCDKCPSNDSHTLYGCKCALQVLHHILLMPQAVNPIDITMLSFLCNFNFPVYRGHLLGDNVSSILAQKLQPPENRSLSCIIEISGVVYCKYGKATCRIRKDKGNWVTECCCEMFSANFICSHTASLPFALRKNLVSFYNGNYWHYMLSKIPHSATVTNLLRYCHTYHCEVLLIQEISKYLETIKMDDGDSGTANLPGRVLVHTKIDDNYIELYSMPESFLVSLNFDKQIGTVTFLEPFIAATVDGKTVVVKLNSTRSRVDEAYCKCSKADVMWCPHVVAVLRKIASGQALDYMGLRNELQLIFPPSLVHLFLRVLFETGGDLQMTFNPAGGKEVAGEWIEKAQEEVTPVEILSGPIAMAVRKPSFWKRAFPFSTEAKKEEDVEKFGDIADYLSKVKALRTSGDLDNAFGLLFKLTDTINTAQNDVHRLEKEWISLIEKSSISSPMALDWSSRLDAFANLFVEARSLVMYTYSIQLDDSTFIATILTALESEMPAFNAIHLLGWVRSARERGKLLEAYFLCMKILIVLVYDSSMNDEMIIQVHGLVHNAISEIILEANAAIKEESLLTGIEPLSKIAARSAAQYVFKYYEIKAEINDDLHSLYTTFQPLTHCIPYVITELIVVSAPTFLKNGVEIFQLAQLFLNIGKPRFALVLGIRSLAYSEISPDSVLDLCDLILLSNDGSYNKLLIETCEQCDQSVVAMLSEKMMSEKRPQVALQLAAVAAKKRVKGLQISFILNLLPALREEEDIELFRELISCVALGTPAFFEIVLRLEQLGLLKSSIVALEYISAHKPSAKMVAQHFVKQLENCTESSDRDFVISRLKHVILTSDGQELLSKLAEELTKIGNDELALLAVAKNILRVRIPHTGGDAPPIEVD